MEKNDAQLIQDTLSGDDAAFSTLVEKYQRGETWNAFCPKPEGEALGLIITDEIQAKRIGMFHIPLQAEHVN